MDEVCYRCKHLILHNNDGSWCKHLDIHPREGFYCADFYNRDVFGKYMLSGSRMNEKVYQMTYMHDGRKQGLRLVKSDDVEDIGRAVEGYINTILFNLGYERLD